MCNIYADNGLISFFKKYFHRLLSVVVRIMAPSDTHARIIWIGCFMWQKGFADVINAPWDGELYLDHLGGLSLMSP